MAARPAPRGFTMIEIMITLTVLGFLLMLGLPDITEWLRNVKIRTEAESILNGLQLARANAVQRNVTVRFSLVDSLSSTCALSSSGASWVVSLADPTGACNVDPSDTTAPKTIQKKDGSEASGSSVTVAATGGTAVTFNGLGRIINNADGSAPMSQIDISSTASARSMRVALGASGIVVGSGNVRMCDPSVLLPADPRGCCTAVC